MGKEKEKKTCKTNPSSPSPTQLKKKEEEEEGGGGGGGDAEERTE